MKKSLLLVVLFCFLAANTVFAQGKIAIIDVQAITFQSKAGQKSIEELKGLLFETLPVNLFQAFQVLHFFYLIQGFCLVMLMEKEKLFDY